MNEKIKMISCGKFHSMIYLENNDLLVFGRNDYGQLGLGHNKNQNDPIKLMNEKIKMISFGWCHSMIYLENNDLLVFGMNNDGQLGLCHNKNQNNLLN